VHENHLRYPPVAMPVTDAHTHAFPDNLAPQAIDRLIHHAYRMEMHAHHDGTVAGLLRSMADAGIERSVLCSVATKPTQVTRITEWCVELSMKCGGAIVPFGSIHPDFEHPEAEMERMASLGIRGVKIHPQYMGCAMDDPRILRICRAAKRCNLAVTVHCGLDPAFEDDDLASPERLAVLHAAVPDLRLLACHLGGFQRWDDVAERLVGEPIYFETSFALGFCPPSLLESILTKHPKEYLLFGSDTPWRSQKGELAAFRALNIPQSSRDSALTTNADRFLATT
jgi:uncharacterized protein